VSAPGATVPCSGPGLGRAGPGIDQAPKRGWTKKKKERPERLTNPMLAKKTPPPRPASSDDFRGLGFSRRSPGALPERKPWAQSLLHAPPVPGPNQIHGFALRPPAPAPAGGPSPPVHRHLKLPTNSRSPCNSIRSAIIEVCAGAPSVVPPFVLWPFRFEALRKNPAIPAWLGSGTSRPVLADREGGTLLSGLVHHPSR